MAENLQRLKKGGKRKMSGWLIALIVVVGLSGVGTAVFGPRSPVYKKIEAACSRTGIEANK